MSGEAAGVAAKQCVPHAADMQRVTQLQSALAQQQALMDEGSRILKAMSQRFKAVQVEYEPARVAALDLTNSQRNAESLREATFALLEHLKAADKV